MVEKPVLIIDTREKHPWDWEADASFSEVVYQKLDAGDYSIKGMETIISIERKASVDELFINFTQNKDRIKAEFERMKDYKFKFMVVECNLEDVMNPYKYYVNKKKINRFSNMMPVAVVTAGLTALMLEYGVQVIFGGSKSQSMVRGILLKAYELHRKGKL